MTQSSTPRSTGPIGLPGAAPAHESTACTRPAGWRDRAWIFALLALVTLAAHGWSLQDGLFLDDHWHQARIREMDWSIHDALHVTTIDTDSLIHSWWQDKPVRWIYARPVAVLLQKGVYELTGGSVVAQHAVSLILHYLTVCMVFQLCFLLTGHRGWSVVGGVLMAVYAHGVITVAWLAAQNAVLQTALMLAALLCYVRASGLNLAVARIGSPISDGLAISDPLASRPPPVRLGAFLAFFVLWVLALFSRENAVMLPAIVVAFDLAFGGRRQLRDRWRVYVFMGGVALAFLVWRLAWHYEPMPDIYQRRPDGPGYVIWCGVKLMHYLCGSVWHSPMTIGPSGRIDPLREVPGDCLLMLAILVLLGSGYYRACRGLRGWWIWPVWMVLAVLPVVPLIATPHSGYVNGVAFSVAVVLGPAYSSAPSRRLAGLAGTVGDDPRRLKPAAQGSWCKPVALFFLVATCAYVPIYRSLFVGMVAAERITMASIAADESPEDVTDVFFINLPFVNVYAKQCFEEQWPESMKGVRCHALTFAPNLLSSENPCVVQRLGKYSFSLTSRGQPYFSGLLGRFFLEGMRGGEPLVEGLTIEADGFDVRIDRIEQQGVRALTFIFPEPLASRKYRFYLSTPDCPAVEMRFDRQAVARRGEAGVEYEHVDLSNVQSVGNRLVQGDARAGEALLGALEPHDGWDEGGAELRKRAWLLLEPVLGQVARATGSPLQDAIHTGNPPADGEVARLRRWWRDEVDDALLDRVWLRRHDLDSLRWRRDGFARVRAVAGQIIRTDLYLSGPPFSGPRFVVSEKSATTNTVRNP